MVAVDGLDSCTLELLIEHRGRVLPKISDSLMAAFDQRLQNSIYGFGYTARIRRVALELVQNLFHHGHPDTKETDPLYSEETYFAIYSDSDLTLLVRTINLVPIAVGMMLRERLDHINGISASELEDLYHATLQNNEYSSRGGAGLGLIDVARKSVRPLKARLTPFNAQLSRYEILVRVRRLGKSGGEE